MILKVRPGSKISGETTVPGDKSIAHRWLMLAAIGEGRSRIAGMTTALDVASTARCMSSLTGREIVLRDETMGEGAGGTLVQPQRDLDCGNSGTTMRLLAGILASQPFHAVLRGDESLSVRPMERVAEPLRMMGAVVETTDGHAPVTIEGRDLVGIRYELPVASAQVKGAVLFAGLAASGETTVVEPAATRDHTERALGALGAPIRHDGNTVSVSRFRNGGLESRLPGDISAAAYVIAAAAVTGGDATVRDAGLNPSRLRFVEVLRRMRVNIARHLLWESLSEPAGDVEAGAGGRLRGTRVSGTELPLVIDEVPVLAAVAVSADGESRFEGAGELRAKESDRLVGLAEELTALGAAAEVQGDSLVVAGGGAKGGKASARGDHRLAMALTVCALAASGESEIEGVEFADITFPGFVDVMRRLGADIEPA